MAQKIEVRLVDDIDGGEATETVQFGIDGKAYEIDLNEAHAQALRDAVATYVGHARKASGGKSGGSKKSTKEERTGNAAAIREWAQGKGITIPAKGRIPGEVRDQYERATA
jgi:hypothetical protein